MIRIQYTVRSLLIVTLLTALVLGWLCTLWRSTVARRRAVEAIQRLGGDITYQHQYGNDGQPLVSAPLGVVVSPEDAPRPGPFVLRSLLWNDAFWRVHSCSLISVRSLKDDDLVVLKDLHGLKVVYLCCTPIGDRGVAALVSAKELRTVNVGTTYVTDVAVRRLRELPHLEDLTLFQTRVTDQSIPDLAAMRHLKYLYVAGSSITAAGMQRLKAMRPDLKEGDMIWILESE